MTSESGKVAGPQDRWATVQGAALVIGAVFVLIGVAGFIPGVTTAYHAMSWAGQHQGAKLLGVFEVSVLHNAVHLAFGVAGLLLSRTINGARGFLILGGIINLILGAYGMLIDLRSGANFVPFNTADNWLHFALGAVMILLGLVSGGRS